VARQINQLAGGEYSETIPWGPDKNYYEVGAGAGKGAIAAGMTGRDFNTFGRASTEAGMAARIVCCDRDIPKSASNFGPNVSLEIHQSDKPQGYRRLAKSFAAARVLAIPLYAQDTLAGLTSLMDALGVGRPVIVTRNPLLDLDVEALGIGRWVNTGDVSGWIAALRWFDSHPTEAMEMGRKARALVDGGLHSAAFADRMMSLFNQVLAEDKVSRPK
jgi:glycosyltransferase involved in cell wall biosynthesis